MNTFNCQSPFAAPQLFRKACSLAIGAIFRLLLSSFKQQRSEDFIVGGYMPGNRGMDELLLGVREGKNLRFVESVKNGLTS